MENFDDIFGILNNRELFFGSSLWSYPKQKIVYKNRLEPVELSDEFVNKYGIPNDMKNRYCNLYIDNQKISDTLYRMGGLCDAKKMNNDNYSLIIKVTPAVHTKDEMEKYKSWGCKNTRRKYLREDWAVIDMKTGKEVFTCEQFQHPQIYKNVLHYKNDYIFLPTGETICKNTYSSKLSNDNYIALIGEYPKNEIILINLITGEKSIFV